MLWDTLTRSKKEQMLLAAASHASAGEILLQQRYFTQVKLNYYIYKNGVVKSQEALHRLCWLAFQLDV